jgi:hypothetical protein
MDASLRCPPIGRSLGRTPDVPQTRPRQDAVLTPKEATLVSYTNGLVPQ